MDYKIAAISCLFHFIYVSVNITATDKMIRRPQWRKLKTFACPICGQGFMMCHDMQRHAREVHYSIDPNMCDECGKTFVNRFNLRAHKKLHSDEKPFQCNVCDKMFKTNSQLTKHGYVHTGEKRLILHNMFSVYSRKSLRLGRYIALSWHDGCNYYCCHLSVRQVEDLVLKLFDYY